jgi:hypothetical protein
LKIPAFFMKEACSGAGPKKQGRGAALPEIQIQVSL